MYKTLFIVLITVIAAVTLGISISKPDMHKLVMVYDSQYVVVDTETKTKTVKTQPVEVKRTEQVKTNSIENNVIFKPQTKQIESNKINVQTKKQVAQPYTTTAKVQKLPEVQSVQKIIPQQQAVKTVINEPEFKTQVQQQIQPKVNVVQQTTQEELILWNKWRSNIQNQLMKDAKTKLPLAPDGTEFRVSFDVDKFGKVTNIYTKSSNPNYTNYAIQCIPPIVRSYQGRAILEFPSGSNRMSTTVECAWRVSQTAKYSTSKDYNDTEKVVK